MPVTARDVHMASTGMPRPPVRSPASRLRAFGRDRSGATAVEFAFVGMIMITLLLAILQFSIAFLSQMNIHHALSDAATGNNAQTLAGNRTSVVTQICGKLLMIDNCAANLKLETQALASYSTVSQPITGATFTASALDTPMLMRASAPVVTFVPFLPHLRVSGAALYMRRS